MVASRYPIFSGQDAGGVNNAALYSTLQTLPTMDRTGVYEFFDDFQWYRGASNQDWLATNANGGTAVVQDENFGTLLVTNGANDNFFYSAQWQGFNTGDVAEIFKIDLTKDFWFKSRFQVSNATDTDAIIGLLTTNTDPIAAVVDGIYLFKPDDSTTLSLRLTKNSASTTISLGTMANATYVTAGFHYSPLNSGSITAYFNDVRVAGTATLTNLIDDEEIAPTFTIQNGSAGAKSMKLDYIYAACMR